MSTIEVLGDLITGDVFTYEEVEYVCLSNTIIDRGLTYTKRVLTCIVRDQLEKPIVCVTTICHYGSTQIIKGGKVPIGRIIKGYDNGKII